MASTYFTLPSFAKAKKHTDDLEKTGVKDPVLNEADEQWLTKITSNEADNSSTHVPKTRITDDGAAAESKEASPEGIVIFPGKQADGKPATKSEKSTLNELPSQEEAEAATKGFQSGALAQADKADSKRTWASYVPSLPTTKSDGDGRSWSEYASSIVPGNLSLPALPKSWTKTKDVKAEIVYKEDGTVDEEATKSQQEKEVSVLLDNLNLSSINNRVFAFSQESQKFYERFVQVLKDVMNGVPTAYDDMEKLMKDAGPTIEKQWNAMPPFVQTLVKALPAKLGATLAPELLASTAAKPGFDAKVASDKTSKDTKGKKKRSFKIPGLKGLVKKQGLAATILRNIVVFFETRFPFLVGTTNVIMSLSVFVLMFVFYYCWKRGREVRLAKEADMASSSQVDGAAEDDDELDVEISSDDDEESKKSQQLEANIAKSVEQKNQILSQKDPAQVALPLSDGAEKM